MKKFISALLALAATLALSSCGGSPAKMEVSPASFSQETRDVLTINSHLVELVRSAAKEHGLEMTTCSGSTDCNIPLSQGVPAVCFGVYLGEGAHTRGEHISISSLDVGMEIFAQVVLSHFE